MADSLETQLLAYETMSERDRCFREDALLFLQNESNAFCRENTARHFTGSAVIVDSPRTSILLTHHRKLGKWLQLGGHCDGIRDPFFVAWKEAYEESGLEHIQPITQHILDVEIHPIPTHGDVPEHLHYDIRYLFEADPSEPLTMSDESNDLRWVPLADLEQFNDEMSFLVLRGKIRGLPKRSRP